MKTFYIETFGCQMNAHDSEKVIGTLIGEGYSQVETPDEAELLLYNTCSIRDKAEQKVFHRLQQFKRNSQGKKIAVLGCVAQQEGDKLFSGAAPIDVVVGTQAIKQLPALLAKSREEKRKLADVNPYEDVSFPLGMAKPTDAVRAWVTIIEGCNEFCSFCVVPYTRGHERMRPVADILAEVREAARTGHREVQLLGQIVNHYQAPDES